MDFYGFIKTFILCSDVLEAFQVLLIYKVLLN
jgi:hypothetical protein